MPVFRFSLPESILSTQNILFLASNWENSNRIASDLRPRAFLPPFTSYLAMSSDAVPSLGMTFGAVYISTTIAAILFGVTNLQTVIYYQRYPDDGWIYRYSVAILWFLDALHVAFSTHALYYYLVDLFGNYLGLSHIVWSFKLQILISKAIIIGVQAVYVVRLWKLGRHFHRILPWFVILNVAAALGTVVFSVYDVYQLSVFSSTSSIRGAIYAVFSVTAISDFIIAFAMCYYLHKCRQVSPFSSTSAMLLGLMQLVVISGLATGPCEVLILLMYLIWPESLIFLALDFVLPKFYINSLLAMHVELTGGTSNVHKK
ncbi:uncharacterized protein EV420DRAFT_1077155 [Desarmillaria tabescens]|uniref:DUF6534 domain-containing protein n=1 Tax=Armillaria tabescens TaxID=1929756 RepID=A0AA39MQP3_ARMTA|nr:uncharacterized protein EV420DRAFT_1077155 [Desarmillaria tabescens]KAK0442519.1 hypothetical protein EV420DRAFT_1077155 [Desarmillaria tabescens]